MGAAIRMARQARSQKRHRIRLQKIQNLREYEQIERRSPLSFRQVRVNERHVRGRTSLSSDRECAWTYIDSGEQIADSGELGRQNPNRAPELQPTLISCSRQHTKSGCIFARLVIAAGVVPGIRIRGVKVLEIPLIEVRFQDRPRSLWRAFQAVAWVTRRRLASPAPRDHADSNVRQWHSLSFPALR